MRLPSALAASAVAAWVVIALAGCADSSSGGAPTSTPSASATSAAVQLAGTTWRVGAAGASGTRVHFDGTAVTVSSGDRSSSYAWTAQGDAVLIGRDTSSLAGSVPATWLTRAVRVHPDGGGWVLLGRDGSLTARLTPAPGVPSAAPTTPTGLLQRATPGPGVIDAPPTALEGRWTVPGSPITEITFTADSWVAASSCATGALGGRGRYRVLPGGRLLVVRTASPIRGCPIVDGTHRLGPNAVTAVARAGSFRVTGDTLRLFDRSGTSLGSLHSSRIR